MAPSPNRPVWAFRLADERSVRARTPVIVNDRLYAVFTYQRADFFESLLLCFDLASGAEIWRASIDHVLSEPVLDRAGQIFVSSFGGQALAFDPSGRALWRGPETGRNLWKPTILSSDRLVVPEIAGGSRYIWCLDAGTGQEVWRYETGGHTRAVVASDDLLVQITNISGDDPAKPTNLLTALRIGDGALVWSALLSHYPGSLALVGDRVVVGARGAVLAFDLATGRALAEMRTADEAGFGPLLSLDADAFALADTENTLRVVDVQAKRGLFRSSVALVERWRTKLPAPAIGGPERLSSNVAMLGNDGTVSLHSIQDGATGFSFRVAGEKRADAGGLASNDRFLAAGVGRTLAVFERS